MLATQAASIAFSIVSAIFFGTVAYVLARREVSAPMRGANRAFVTWWAAIGASGLLTGMQMALAVSGFRSVPFFMAVGLVNLVLVCLALWGLLHYLMVLIANTRSFAYPLAFLYVLLAAYFAYLTFSSKYTTVEVDGWTAMLGPQEVPSLAYLVILLALILGPQMLAALAYLTLAFRVDDPVARKRILIVSLSILIWFGSATVVALATPRGSKPGDTWQLVSRLLGVGAAAAILYAYLGLTPGTSAAAQEGDKAPETPAAPTAPKERLSPAHPPAVA